MGKVGGETKDPNGGIVKILHNSFCDYKMLQNTRTYSHLYYLLSVIVIISWSQQRSLLWVYDSQTMVLCRHVLGEVSPKTWNFPPPRIFATSVITTWILKLKVTLLNGICYLLSEVLIFVEKCTKSPNSSIKSPQFQQTPRFQQKNRLQAY